jgi:hypothetical protein
VLHGVKHKREKFRTTGYEMKGTHQIVCTFSRLRIHVTHVMAMFHSAFLSQPGRIRCSVL